MIGRLNLLGVPTFETEGKTITSFRSNRLPAMMGILASKREPWSREAIAQALWPDSLSEEGRHNLRQLVLQAKKLLGENIFHASKNSLELSSGIVTDVDILFRSSDIMVAPEESVKLAEDAVATYRGEFLQGFDDDWLFFFRAECSKLYVNALMFLADHFAKDNPARSLEYAERAIAVEPYLDGARARKITALRQLGEESVAHLEYSSFKKLLATELGIEPSQLVSTALLPASKGKESAPKADSITSGIQESMDVLLGGNRPYQGVDLALASIPFWKAKGLAEVGVELLAQAMTLNLEDANSYRSQRLKVGIADLMATKGKIFDAKEMLRKAMPSLSDGVARVRALLILARISQVINRSFESRDFVAEALRITELQDLEDERPDVLRRAADVELDLEDLHAVEDFAAKCQEISRVRQDWQTYATCITLICEARFRRGNIDGVRDLAYSALEQLKGKSTAPAVFTRIRIYRLLEEMEGVADAEIGYRKGIDESRACNDMFGLAIVLTYLGDLMNTLGKYEEAVNNHREALDIRRTIHDKLGEATSLRGLGVAMRSLGNLDQASKYLRESAQLFLDCDAEPGHASALQELAIVSEIKGDYEMGLRIASRAKHLLVGLSPLARQKIGPRGHEILEQVDSMIKRLTFLQESRLTIN
jgi:DNA-binding SARP family transcriptional activator